MSQLIAMPGALLRLIGSYDLMLSTTLTHSGPYIRVNDGELAEVIDVYGTIMRVWFPRLRKYSTELINDNIYWRFANEEK